MLRLALITTDNREDRRDYSPATPWFGTAVQALLDGFAEMPEEIEVHVVSCSRARLESPLRLAPNIHFHSVRVPAWAWLKTFYLANALSVRKLLSRIQPQIVHGQGTERDCALCAVLSGHPNVITLHGNMRRLARLASARPWSFAGITAFLEAFAIRFAHGVICLSSHTLKLAAPTARKTWSIPNAVDQRFTAISRRTRRDIPVLLMIADVLPNKNPLGMLRAIASLRTELEFEAHLVGKCDNDTAYGRQVADFSHNHPWCRMEGYLDRDHIRSEMSEATALILPSLEENLPMVVLEAMAAELPVAASAVGGIPDLIVDNVTGKLFDPRDAASIQSTVRTLLENPETARAMAVNAKNMVLRHHQPVEIARNHLAVYREILTAASPA